MKLIKIAASIFYTIHTDFARTMKSQMFIQSCLSSRRTRKKKIHVSFFRLLLQVAPEGAPKTHFQCNDNFTALLNGAKINVSFT